MQMKIDKYQFSFAHFSYPTQNIGVIATNWLQKRYSFPKHFSALCKQRPFLTPNLLKSTLPKYAYNS